MSGNKKDPSVVIIGAGMTGMLLVIKLREMGITNITLLEKKENVGGTWRENTYPGVACDVPAHAYTYSFAPNPEWSGLIAPGDEIHRYFIKVFEDYEVGKNTRFNEAVTSCVYNDGEWTVKTSQDNTYKADLVFSATGLLHKPVTPDFPGMDTFKGAKFHSAEWDHNVKLKGRRIGVIGTGSTAAQIIPELVDMEGTDVTVFQRTPQWLAKLENKPYSEKQKQKFREKASRMEMVKNVSLYLFAKGTTALTSDKFFDRQMHRLMAWNAKNYLNKTIKNPELRAKLTPDYKFGCKRVVMSATFYDAIQKPNAHLVTEGIGGLEEGGIKTKDGQLHELDVIVFATGFDPAAYMRPMEFLGRGGVSIDEAWKKKIQAYRSMMIPQFPNFFLMLGPNSPIGNYSVISMSEIQVDYCLRLVKEWQRGRLENIEAKPEAVQSWAEMLKSKMGHTVWASGCQSWYLDADGDPLTWPDTWKAWVDMMKDLNLNDFVQNDTPVTADDKAESEVVT